MCASVSRQMLVARQAAERLAQVVGHIGVERVERIAGRIVAANQHPSTLAQVVQRRHVHLPRQVEDIVGDDVAAGKRAVQSQEVEFRLLGVGEVRYALQVANRQQLVVRASAATGAARRRRRRSSWP